MNVNTNDTGTSAKIVLVTGASGLVGAELATQLLASGYTVKAQYNRSALQDFKSDKIMPFKCDILDTAMLDDALEGVEQVYHCAAIVSFDKKLRSEVIRVNVDGTTNVVNACLDAGVKLLHVSSVAALGPPGSDGIINEDSPWEEVKNHDFYGRSKFLAEIEVWRGIGEGLNAAIVNPSTILGGNNWNRGSSKIFKTAYEEFPWYTEGVTGFVDVHDVVKAMILLMESDITNERFILNAENVSYKNIFSSMATAFGKRPPYKKVTPMMAEMVWRLETLKSMISSKEHLLNKETARKALNKNYFDNSKFKKFFPAFAYRGITETINETCAVLKEIYA